jgi:arabinose-5-phosphate isomerase
MILNKILDKNKNNFEYFQDNINETYLEELVNLLIDNKDNNIFFIGIGKSGNVANHISDILKSISFKTFYFNAINLVHGDLGSIKKDNLLFIFSKSGNTKEILDVIDNMNCQKYLFSCQKDNKISKKVIKNFVIPLKEELDLQFNLIPTNSILNTISYFNIVTNLIINKSNIKQDEYNLNHCKGNIGFLLKPISEFIDYNINTYNKNISIEECIQNLNNDKKGILIFKENKYFYGIITSKDIMNLYKLNIQKNTAIDNFINKNPFIINNKNLLLKNCINDIKKFSYFKYIPVIDENKFIGLICNKKILENI